MTREVGRGGRGVVYLARDDRLQREVALKALSPDLVRDEEDLARLKREARIIAQLNHPHIAQIYHLLEHEGETYLVLEYVPGRSLSERIREEGALDPEIALDLCGQVARAMEAAHERGIVHRDLKPGNVQVTEEGTAKVLDFGIAHRDREGRGGTEEAMVAVDSGKTAAPTVVTGTPGYMAPEQILGQPVDARADIFSFGCLLYECLTGKPVFDAETTAGLISVTLTEEPDWSRLPQSVPVRVRQLLQECLIKDAAHRLQATAVARRVLDEETGRRLSLSPPELPVAEVPNNLQRPTTSFIGREAELKELAELLSRSRLLTLTGPGGCGKTRLALELAYRMLGRFLGGTFFAELAYTSNPDLVPAAVAAALGVKDRPNESTLVALGEHLVGETTLLVIDNCEHVLEAASNLAGALLHAAPRLRILATSREPLHVHGEQIWTVPSLSVPRAVDRREAESSEAITLFVRRARAVRPAFDLSESNAAALARICRRLDGIPLAIELAAARVKVLTPDEIEKHLQDRFRLLVGDERGVVERHRTLRAAVDWSYDLLSGSERGMLRRLSVFADGWTLEGAEAVCGPAGRAEDGSDLDEFAVLDHLTRLVDKSLVLVDDRTGESRYRLLETVRQYAVEKLRGSAEEAEARSRHLDFHLALAERITDNLSGSQQAAALRRLETEHRNMLAALDGCKSTEGGGVKALRLCRAIMRFWLLRGHFETGLEACRKALAHQTAQERSAHRAGALHAAGVMSYSLGDYLRAMEFACEALGIQRELGDLKGVALSLGLCGNSAYYQGDLKEAKRLHEEALAIQRQLENEPGLAVSLNNLANVEHDRAHLAAAQLLYEEALEINRRTGNQAWQAINLYNLGLVAYHRGDCAEAKNLHEESYAIRSELGDRRGIAESRNQLGRLARDQGDPAAARRAHGESLSLQRELGEKLGMAESLDSLAMVASCLREHERAARLVGATEQLRERIGAPRPVHDQEELDRCLAATRKALGEARFAAAVLEGRAPSLGETVRAAEAWALAEKETGEVDSSETPTIG